MKVKALLVQVFLENTVQKADLDLRNIFVDTIEDRNLGEITEVTSSENILEVIIECQEYKSTRLEEIKNILTCMGFNNYLLSFTE